MRRRSGRIFYLIMPSQSPYGDSSPRGVSLTFVSCVGLNSCQKPKSVRSTGATEPHRRWPPTCRGSCREATEGVRCVTARILLPSFSNENATSLQEGGSIWCREQICAFAKFQTNALHKRKAHPSGGAVAARRLRGHGAEHPSFSVQCIKGTPLCGYTSSVSLRDPPSPQGEGLVKCGK